MLQKGGAGAPYGPVVVRPSSPARSCAATAPICVHGAPDAALVRARQAMTEAWGGVVDGVGMPAPLRDGLAGGDARFDVYVVDALPEGAESLDGVAIGRDPIELLADRDATPAFLLVDAGTLAGPRCPLARALAWGVAEASAAGVDVAETRVVVDGLSRHVAEIASGCGVDVAAHAAFQGTPWRALDTTPEGPRALVAWLDRTRSTGFGALVPALESLATQHGGLVVSGDGDATGAPSPAHFRDSVTIFDVLSETMKQQRSSLDELMLEFTVERGFDRAAPPPAEWTIAASTLPRRLLVSRGIEPTGATYVRVDLDARPKDEALSFELKWEIGASFRWTAVKLDAQGTSLGEVAVAPVERLRELAVDVRHLEGAASVLLVGWNAGDPERPWAPDAPLTLPHGYEVAIYAGVP